MLDTALVKFGRVDQLVVSSGVKSLLDVLATVEQLETLGVPVLGSVLSMTPAKEHPEYGYGYRRYRPVHNASPNGETTASEREPEGSHAAR